MALRLGLKLSLHRRRLFPLRHNVKALHQFNFYSTLSADDPQQPGNPIQSSHTTNQHSVQSTIWPKPKEIPYQSKVANYVNLLGYVETPVHSHADPDGKHFSAIVISQKSIDKKSCLSVPVVFYGDLAHVVAYHVKPRDRVWVSGRLSEEPLKFSIGEGLGKFHVVGEDVNFVEGFGRNACSKKVEVSFAAAGLEKTDLYKNVDNSSIGKKDYWTDRKINEEEWWNDLVKNPDQWWDYRGHKSNGLVKERFPDFKHKLAGGSLWINSAPRWVSTEIGRLKLDVKAMQAGLGDSKIGRGNKEDLWKGLIENPNGWWDNRLDKRHPKYPDFKHKETHQGLWLSDLPNWALSKLPPPGDARHAADFSGLLNPFDG